MTAPMFSSGVTGTRPEEESSDGARAEAARSHLQLGPQTVRGVQDLGLADQHDVLGVVVDQVQAPGAARFRIEPN